jgi:hypothetical protein
LSLAEKYDPYTNNIPKPREREINACPKAAVNVSNKRVISKPSSVNPKYLNMFQN